MFWADGRGLDVQLLNTFATARMVWEEGPVSAPAEDSESAGDGVESAHVRPQVVPLGQATRTWFAISLQTFGGPAGQIAVMHHELVDQRRWSSGISGGGPSGALLEGFELLMVRGAQRPSAHPATAAAPTTRGNGTAKSHRG